MLDQILRDHKVRYPAMTVQDVYKLIHQAVMGNTHYVLDHNQAKEFLADEISEMGDGPLEPMFDPISSDGVILRVHLRTYLAETNDLQPLLEAFIRSAELVAGGIEQLESAWVRALRTRLWEPSEMNQFYSRMRDQGFPSVHHSKEFKERYRPAYRVVNRKYLHNLLNWDQGSAIS